MINEFLKFFKIFYRLSLILDCKLSNIIFEREDPKILLNVWLGKLINFNNYFKPKFDN